ncbi:MAG TPA: phosphatase PAP2 family protein [Thermoanaerobaculia bacterium]
MNKERRVTIAIAAMLVIFPVQYAINAAILSSRGIPLPLFSGVYQTLINFTGLAVAGIAAGIVVSALRRELRLHLDALRSRPWLGSTLVLIVGVSMVGYLYGMLKISVHLVRRTTYDGLLWEIDRWLMLGISPNVFLLESLSHPLFYRTFDKLYAFAFFFTMIASFLLIFGWRDPRERIGYLAGSVVLWIAGAWLYFAVPSLGPAYAFYDVWDAVRAHFPTTMTIQKMLINNHLRVLETARGARGIPIHIQMGIAAFPSLHVAFHAYFAFWLQRLVPKLRLLGWILVTVMFIGSVITGWHYMIDSVAGIVLAWVSWRVGRWVAGERTPPSAAKHEMQNAE